jgi:hypothetical protein
MDLLLHIKKVLERRWKSLPKLHVSTGIYINKSSDIQKAKVAYLEVSACIC